MSRDTYWLADSDKPHDGDVRMIMFEVIHPNEPSNGTDGTPQVRVHTFLNGKVDEYAKWLSLQQARSMWHNSIGMGYVQVEAQWDKELGASIIWK